MELADNFNKPNEIKTAIDICCEAFIDSVYLTEKGIKVTSIGGVINNKFYEELPEATRKNITIQKQNLTNLNLPKGRLNLFSCWSALFTQKKILPK